MTFLAGTRQFRRIPRALRAPGAVTLKAGGGAGWPLEAVDG
jgi:hypothetical protein